MNPSSPTPATDPRNEDSPRALTALPRRTMLSVLGAGTAAASLAACGKGGSSSSGAGSDYTPGSAELKTELGEEIDGVLYPDDYEGPRARKSEPFGEGKEFSIVTRSEAEVDLKTNAFSKYLEKATGVKINYSTVPMGDDGTPKINAMISSGDLPDAFMLGPEWMGGFTRSQLYVYGQQGLFQPLDKAVDEWAPQAVELMKMFPDIRDYLTAPDNAMYTFPSINQCFHCQSSGVRTWMNKNWRKEIGLDDDPSTLDEFEDVLEEFHKAHPDDFPMSGNTDYPPHLFIATSYLDIGNGMLRRDGSKIQYTATLPEFREALARTAELVSKDLIDPNAFTQNGDQFQKLTTASSGSRVGVATAGSQGELGPIDYEDPKSVVNVYQVIRPVAGPSAGPFVPWVYDPGAAFGLVITQKCEDPETLVRWADHQLGLISTLNMRLGVQDENWVWAKKGEKGLSDEQAMYKRKDTGKDEKNLGWDEWGTYSLCLDVRNGEVIDEKTSIEPSLYRAGELYEKWAVKKEQAFHEPFFTTDQAAQVGEYKTNIETAYKQGVANFCLGKSDASDDAAWDSFTKSLDDAGLQQYLQVLTEADEASS